jgi:hypothetical protein
MQIFPLSITSTGSHPHIWTIAKPTSEFIDWLVTLMPCEWWMDLDKSVKRLLDQRQVDPKMIHICLNDEGVMFLKLKWPINA